MVNHDAPLIFFRKYMRINSALFVASMIGAFTLSGYAYLEKYYLTMDVSIERVGISTQEILAYGAARLGSYLGAVAIAMAIIGTVTIFLFFFEKTKESSDKPQALPKWISHVQSRTSENRAGIMFFLCICAIGCLLISAWFFLVRWPSSDGREAALEKASECAERRLTYENLDHYVGCQVAESADMLYLLLRRKCDKSQIEFQTLELPKLGLKSIITSAKFDSNEKIEISGCIKK